MVNKQRKVITDEDKNKALNRRDIAMKSFKEKRQIAEKGGLEEKGSKRGSNDTFTFLRQKLECEKAL